MRQFAAQKVLFEPPQESSFNTDAGRADLNHLLLLAIERALAPPVVHRRNVLQPMRIVVVHPHLPSQAQAQDNVHFDARRVPPRALSPAKKVAPTQLQHRAVMKPVEASGEDSDSRKSETPQKQQTSSVTHRKLFADPGQWRVVWWGEFKEILASQLAHPERLRDTYRIPCYVQVLETERAVTIEELAEVYKSDNKSNARLYFLTDEIAAKLDLLLPLRPAPARDTQRDPNTLLAHERVFRLVAANDPTTDVTVSASTKKPARSLLKEVIPDRFVNEWEFKLTREEVLYDMSVKPGLGHLIRRLLSRLRVIKQAKEFRKWQTLLTGKSVDEQLWSVRPPVHVTDSSLREWAAKTLELGGYDTRKMLPEWEVFWRMKGL